MTEEAIKSPPSRLIELGEIVGTHGVAGLLRLRPYSDCAATLAAVDTVFLTSGQSSAPHPTTPSLPDSRVVSLLSARDHGRVVLLRLAGVDTIEAAEPFVGSVLAVDERELPAPAPGEIYAYRLEGLEVATSDGRTLGHVDETFATGSNDVLVVRDGEREYLVPLIADVVHAIDLDGGRITINALEGLLD